MDPVHLLKKVSKEVVRGVYERYTPLTRISIIDQEAPTGY
jgi:hypothetical protein